MTTPKDGRAPADEDQGAACGTGSREPGPAVPALAGFDPSRIALSEETKAFLREIDASMVRPGDPRMNTVIGPGSAPRQSVETPVDDRGAEFILREAWCAFGGNHQDAEFWNVFSTAVNFTLGRVSSAQAVEARRAETRSGSVHEDAVRAADAPDHPASSTGTPTLLPPSPDPSRTDELARLSAAATQGLLAEELEAFDDWGRIRIAEETPDGRRPVIIRTTLAFDEGAERSAARIEKREPRFSGANRAFVIALWNAYRSGQLVPATTPASRPEALAIPPGWRLVPEEPTEEMIQAKCEAELRFNEPGGGADRAWVGRMMAAGYRAMLVATPSAPAPGPAEGAQSGDGPQLERVRHRERGAEYEVLGEAEVQISTRSTCPDGVGNGVLPKSTIIREGRAGYESDRLVVYRCVKTGKLWCRLPDEFRDGRFESLDRCIACEEVIRDGDLVLPDAEGGYIHRACCGPERESFTGADGEPLKDGAPIPEGRPYRAEIERLGQQPPCEPQEQAPPAQSGDGWEPIETAPKDGTHVLAGMPGASPIRAFFMSNRWWMHGCGAWSEHPADLTGRFAPTHWRPLPSPPRLDRQSPPTAQAEQEG